MRELRYHNNKLMNPEPINRKFCSVSTVLKDEHPLVVQLEPGDGTHYSLLITPAAHPYIQHSLGRWGIPDDIAQDYLLVTKLDQMGPMASIWINVKTEIGVWQTAKLSPNEWSQELLAWWLNLVCEDLRARHGPR